MRNSASAYLTFMALRYSRWVLLQLTDTYHIKAEAVITYWERAQGAVSFDLPRGWSDVPCGLFFSLRKMASSNSASTLSTRNCNRSSLSWLWRLSRLLHWNTLLWTDCRPFPKSPRLRWIRLGFFNAPDCYTLSLSGRVRPGGHQVDSHWVLQQQDCVRPHWK